MNLTLLATPLVVLALVNLGKSLGVTGRWSALLAVLLGVALAVADYVFLGDGTIAAAGVYTACATGLILGLTAAGLYDVADKIGGTTSGTRYVERGADGDVVAGAADEL